MNFKKLLIVGKLVFNTSSALYPKSCLFISIFVYVTIPNLSIIAIGLSMLKYSFFDSPSFGIKQRNVDKYEVINIIINEIVACL